MSRTARKSATYSSLVVTKVTMRDHCHSCSGYNGNILPLCGSVTAFTSEEDALRSLQSAKSTFHAAMLDATNRDVFDGFKLLAAAKNLAVIMVSSTEDIQTMMRAISLGAADFLQKPFSEEKLKNIWQHVARRAMVGTETTIPSSDQLFEDFGSIVGEFSSDSHVDQPSDSNQKFNLEEGFMESASLELCDTSCIKLEVLPSNHSCIKNEVDDHLPSNQSCIKLEMDDLPADTSCIDEHYDDLDGIVLDAEGGPEFNLDAAIFADIPPDSDSDSALDINFELLDSGDTHDFQNSGDTTHDSEFDREDAMMLAQVLQADTEDQVACNISESSESMSITSSSARDKGEEQTKPERASKPSKSAPARKKMKVDWTPELHHKFVQAVEQLGVDKAIPSRILEHMGVKCLTRHNIASHLQKYRSHRKHLLQREAEAAANWRSKNKASIQPRHQTPILPAPPPGGVPLVVWGHPTVDPCTGHLWQHPAPPPTWQAPDGTLWQHPAACFPPWGHHAPAPGTPVYPTCMRTPVAPMIGVPQQPVAPQENHLNPPSCLPPREVVDAVISEALTNPCTLPLGLKPPSMESVMSELVKQGISITPPTPS